jgi:hypothetical protein
MMKIAGVVAAVVVLATGWSAHSDPLSLQRACAQQAREQFKLLGYDQNDEAEFENHYNAGLNKCLMVLKNYWDTKDAGYYSRCVSKNLIDAFEGKEYGEYLWCSDKEIVSRPRQHRIAERKHLGIPRPRLNAARQADE